MVGIYCVTLDIYYILSKEKYVEQFNTELTANRGKTLLLVQCWLTKKTIPAYANSQHDHTVKQKLYLVSRAVAVDTETTRKALPQTQKMPTKITCLMKYCRWYTH